MASENKNTDVLETERKLLQDFLTTEKVDKLRTALKRLMLGVVSLSSSTLRNCNGADGWDFTSAYCRVEKNKDHMLFASFFRNAVEMLGNYTRKQLLPSTEEEIRVLYRLVRYLFEEDDMKIVESYVPKNRTDTAFCFILANHLLSRLSLHQEYLVDERYRREGDCHCPCGCHGDMGRKFGNTSIGHEDVWHGRLGVILRGSSVQFVPDLIPVDDRKRNDGDTQDVSDARLISQCIVFSFFQRNKHPEFQSSLVPTIGVFGQDFKFSLYDSENDVLLTSPRLRLAEEKSMETLSVLCLWMVLNYHCLGSGLPEFSEPIPRAHFSELVKPKLGVYLSNMRFGDVRSVKRKLGDDCRPVFDRIKVDEPLKRLKAEYDW